MPLRLILLLFFVIEVSLLILVGAEIGLLLTFLEFIVTAMIGSYMVRTQGVSMIVQINRDVKNGVSPETGVMNTFLTVIGGILLIIPGFATDILGILLLIPFVKSRTLNRAHQGLSRNAEKNRKHSSVIINQEDY